MRFVRRKKGVERPDRPRKSRPLVSASYEVSEDGTHALTVPVYTYNPNNGATGHSRAAGVHKSDERKAQRAQVGIYLRLNEVPRHFRGVRLVRLAPSNPGLDTGGLWAALKAPQDEVAKHLGIDDGPNSPASWEMDSEQSPAYGVRIELRSHRAPDYRALCQQLLPAALAARDTLLKLSRVGDAIEFSDLSESDAVTMVARITTESRALELLTAVLPEVANDV